MLISEPSYALGAYRAFGPLKVVRGFCEKDIDYRKHLGLLSLPDIQWIVFDRDDLDDLKQKTIELGDLLLRQFSAIPKGTRSEYRQNSLEKRVSIFPDGSVITENRVSLTGLDARVSSMVPHFIRRTGLKPLPTWNEMLITNYRDRVGKPYFFTQLLEVNGRTDTEWHIKMYPDYQNSTSDVARFSVAFEHAIKEVKPSRVLKKSPLR